MPVNNFRHNLKIALVLALMVMGCTGQFLPKRQPAQTARGETFVLVTAAPGDTLASLAETHLKAEDKAWQIAAFNQIEDIAPGQTVVIPLAPITYGGVHKNGFQVVPVLRYAQITGNPATDQNRTTGTFERHLDFLQSNGFATVSLDEFHDFLEFKAQLPPKAVVVTFDTTDKWAYEIAFPALKARGMRGAFFISPDAAGKKGRLTWHQIAEMAAARMDFGLFGPGTKAPNREDVQAFLQALESEIADSKKIFLKHLNRPCRSFAYQLGKSDDLTIAMLKKHGYELAFTRDTGGNPFFTDNYRIHRYSVPGRQDLAAFRRHLATFRAADLQ